MKEKKRITLIFVNDSSSLSKVKTFNCTAGVGDFGRRVCLVDDEEVAVCALDPPVEFIVFVSAVPVIGRVVS